MKTNFQRLHHTAFVAFPLVTVLLLLSQMLFGEIPVVMLIIWGISIGLLAVVLLACIVQAANRRFRGREWRRQVVRYLIFAAATFAALVVLDLFADRVLWLADGLVALVVGFLGWYEKP